MSENELVNRTSEAISETRELLTEIEGRPVTPVLEQRNELARARRRQKTTTAC